MRRSVMKYVLFSVVLIISLAAYTFNAEPQAAAGKVFQTKDYQIRVTTVTAGLSYPYSFTFLPDGAILIAQLNGQLRIVRNGKLVMEPISGAPKVHYVPGRGGLMDLALHPKFSENHWVYFTYDKPGEKGATPAIGRGT